ncbi:Adenine DNA glycosylase [subsurface metagenome]
MRLHDTFSDKILTWYKDHGRSFPWRREDLSLYNVLITEILLWKTRAETIAGFYDHFFDKYPDPEHLRKAKTTDLLNFLQPLGLQNRRVKMMKMIVENDLDESINEERTFRKKCEVGQYIARATLAIYHGAKSIPIDENIKRLLSRIFDLSIENVRSISKEVDDYLALLIQDDHKKVIWAMIDYSSTICTRKNPTCQDCIFENQCVHHARMN